MTTGRPAEAGDAQAARWVEWALATIVVVAAARMAGFGLRHGFLPYPFEANPNNTFMDFFSTAYWSHRTGAYTVWWSVYPPLSFDLVRSWTRPACYLASPEAARSCDAGALWPVVIACAADAVLAACLFRRADRTTWIPRSVAFACSLPLLASLELGNLILFAFAPFALAESGAIRGRTLRAGLLALAVNFKPYLLIAGISRLVNRRWLWIVAFAAVGLGVYLATWALLPEASPWNLLADVGHYAGGMGQVYGDANHIDFLAARSGHAWSLGMQPLVRLGLGAAAGAVLLAAATPNAAPTRMLTLLILTILPGEAALHTQGFSEDYTRLFILFLVFLEPWDGRSRAIMLICAYLGAVPFDWLIGPTVDTVVRDWRSGGADTITFGLSVGQFARPLLNLIIQAVLTREVVVRALAARNAMRAPAVAGQ